jgi:hypothetical protein
MTRRDKAIEVLNLVLGAYVIFVLVMVLAFGWTFSWPAALTTLLVFIPLFIDGIRIRRADRFMKHHEIKVISHVHDGGSVQVMGARPPTARQMKAWEEFAASLREDREPPSE